MASIDNEGMSESTIPSTPPGDIRMLGLMLLWAEDAHHTFLENLRTTHYPAELLFNPVHIGLFTRLNVSSSELERIQRTLATICGGRKPFLFKIGKLCQWGKTVIVRVNSDKLSRLRKDLNQRYV